MSHDNKAPEVMAPRADTASEPGAARSRDAEADVEPATEAHPGTEDGSDEQSVSGSETESTPASPPSSAKSEPEPPASGKPASKRSKKQGPKPNNVRKLRIERMMSKAELVRRANLSVLTIDRVEKGYGCRMDTKRKILEALGLSLADRVRVFGEEE